MSDREISWIAGSQEECQVFIARLLWSMPLTASVSETDWFFEVFVEAGSAAQPLRIHDYESSFDRSHHDLLVDALIFALEASQPTLNATGFYTEYNDGPANDESSYFDTPCAFHLEIDPPSAQERAEARRQVIDWLRIHDPARTSALARILEC